MQIYSDSDLSNRHIQDEASEAYLNRQISAESFQRVMSTYPSNLYTPNYFIRIALGILTMVAVIFSALLVFFMFLATGKGIGLYLVMAAINYFGLELLIRQKSYYNAGVDNLLMFFSAAFLITGIAILGNSGDYTAVTFVTILTCIYLSIRFVDGFMAVLAFLAFLIFVFLVYIKFGTFAKATAPVLIMIVSAIAYFLFTNLLKRQTFTFYHHCYKAVLQTCLLTFYISCNFFVVKELSNQMFDLHLSINDPIPLGWLFWTVTFVIPIAYVAYGIARKNLIFIRTGLVLTAVTIFTFRYYYHVMPVELEMLIAGSLITASSYILIAYLKNARGEFSFVKEVGANKERIDMKSLILTQVSGKNATPTEGVEFGGGSFGSGGAGGNF